VFVCSRITLERLEQFQPNLVHMTIYIYIIHIYYIDNLYIYKWVYVCLCVCMFQHNSGTPGAISTKLGIHDYI
jgi:hypothetical protein